MRRVLFAAMLLTCGILCCGCTKANPAHSAADPALTTAAAEDAPAQTPDEAETASETMPDQTAETEPQSAGELLIPAPVVSQPDYQGGDGGEENAQIPLPQNFTFRFYDSGFSARLAGGMYQALELDLSAFSPADVQEHFYLFDSNFDGSLDISVPVLYTETQKRYAVFLWDADAEYFADTPVMLNNPQYFEDEKHLTTLDQSGSSTVVTDSVWEHGQLTAKLTASADPEKLTLTVSGTDADGNVISSTESARDQAELSAMLLQFYNRESEFRKPE